MFSSHSYFVNACCMDRVWNILVKWINRQGMTVMIKIYLSYNSHWHIVFMNLSSYSSSFQFMQVESNIIFIKS